MPVSQTWVRMGMPLQIRENLGIRNPLNKEIFSQEIFSQETHSWFLLTGGFSSFVPTCVPFISVWPYRCHVQWNGRLLWGTEIEII